MLWALLDCCGLSWTAIENVRDELFLHLLRGIRSFVDELNAHWILLIQTQDRSSEISLFLGRYSWNVKSSLFLDSIASSSVGFWTLLLDHPFSLPCFLFLPWRRLFIAIRKHNRSYISSLNLSVIRISNLTIREIKQIFLNF